MAKEQQHHYLKIHTALGKDALVLERLSISEGMSRLYLMKVVFIANQRLPDMDRQIGEEIAVSLALGDKAGAPERFFHGRILRLCQLGKPLHNSQGQRYEATVVPRAWAATNRTNCRIFQGKTALDIVEAIMGEHQVSIVKKLNNTPYTYAYCVQYNESDWEFVCRVLAQEGLSFFFRHSRSAHDMVVTDNVKAYGKAAENQVVFCSRDPGRSHISQWFVDRGATANAMVEQGFDFKKPTEKVSGESREKVPGEAFGKRELFQYLGEDAPLNDSAKHTQAHLQGLSQDAMGYRGESNYRSFGVGLTFAFIEHEDAIPAHNEFVVTSMTLHASVPSNSESQSGDGAFTCGNRFECLPTDAVFSPRRLPKPTIAGIQTATVTCGAGEEIHADEHGRVKVQFHWDREGKNDPKSSCWIRVSQSWAGEGFGAQFLPRKGQEVIVEFVNGDPDQPLITGSVYNGRNKMPYSPLDERNSSGFRSRSTTQGGAANYNEVRFDDAKGKELLVIHAERDHALTVENDQWDDVGRKRVTQVGDDDTLSVKKNQAVTVEGDQILTGKKTVTMDAGTRITLVTGAASITMDSSGKIAVKGTTLDLEGTTINLKGAKISLN